MDEDELLESIAEIKAALSAIRQGGQSYTIDTGSSIRTVTMADYASLRAELKELYRELASIQGNGSFNIEVGW